MAGSMAFSRRPAPWPQMGDEGVGVVFGQDTDTDNWRPKLEKLEKHLNLWKSRSLSLVGKSLIINVLGISKLLYLSAVLCVPKWVISKVNNLVWPFLWGSRIETVSRMTCHQSLGKGGLGIFNFQTKSDSVKLASLICNLEDRESKSFFLTKYLLVLDSLLAVRSGVLFAITPLRVRKI